MGSPLSLYRFISLSFSISVSLSLSLSPVRPLSLLLSLSIMRERAHRLGEFEVDVAQLVEEEGVDACFSV